MPNIRILALVVLSDILFTTVFIYSRKRGITPERQDRRRKKIRVCLFFMYMPYIKFQNVLFTRLFVLIQNACVRKRGITQPKIYRICSKINQFIYILVCNYMPNIEILALAVLQIFCPQGCSYIKGHKSRTTRPAEGKNTGPLIFHVHATYKISRILFSRLFLYKMPMFEKGNNTTKNLWNRFKSLSVHLHLGL